MKTLREYVNEGYSYNISSRDFENDKSTIQTIIDILDETSILACIMYAAEEGNLSINSFKDQKFLKELGQRIFDKACEKIDKNYNEIDNKGLVKKL